MQLKNTLWLDFGHYKQKIRGKEFVMSNAYIHYVKRHIVTKYPLDIANPWYSELQTYDNGFNKPAFHITRSLTWPVSEIRRGDYIWLISQLSSPWGMLPPSMDAKIVIEDILVESTGNKKGKIRFIAGSQSKWLPLYNASKMLIGLYSILKNGVKKVLVKSQEDKVGQAFQGIKKIGDPSYMEEYASNIDIQPLHFLSYRVADGTRMAFEKARSLMDEGHAVFWDRWSLPRRLAERREIVADRVLDEVINKKIIESTVVWGIESPRYNEINSYSAKEKELASTLCKYRPLIE